MSLLLISSTRILQNGKDYSSSIIRQYSCLYFANFIPQRLVRRDVSVHIDRHGSSASEGKLLSAATVSAHQLNQHCVSAVRPFDTANITSPQLGAPEHRSHQPRPSQPTSLCLILMLSFPMFRGFSSAFFPAGFPKSTLLTFPVSNNPFMHPAQYILDVPLSSTYKTIYTDACKRHYTIPVFTTIVPVQI